MVAAFKKQNSIAQTGFNLVGDNFTYRGKLYKSEDVIETRVARSVFEHKYVLVGSTFHYSISIILMMKSGEKLQVTEQPTWTSDSKHSDVQQVDNMFEVISKKSWNTRTSKYVRQVEQLGFFDYSGWRFYPERRQFQHLEKNKYFNVGSTQLLKTYGFIAVKDANEGLGTKLLNKIAGGEVGIDTLSDSDVFFALLKHYFGLAWQT